MLLDVLIFQLEQAGWQVLDSRYRNIDIIALDPAGRLTFLDASGYTGPTWNLKLRTDALAWRLDDAHETIVDQHPETLFATIG